MGSAKNIDIVDYGRFASALSVMMFHYVVNGPRAGRVTAYGLDDDLGTKIFSLGYIGVDFFFIVSGFVIALSLVESTPRKFFRSRVLRLWPTFILCMTITTLIRIASGRPDMDVELAQYFVNWTMVAPFLGFNNVDGVYWSLTFELVFYGMMFALLLVGRAGWLEMVCWVWITVMVALALVRIHVPGFSGYFALFCAGCMFSFVWKFGWTYARAIFLFISALYCVFSVMGRVKNYVIADSYIVATITAFFFTVFVVLTSTRLGSMRLPFARYLGLITYPLYLLHAYIGYVFLSFLGNIIGKWPAILLVGMIMIVASYVVVNWFEQPMKKVYDWAWPR